MAYCGHMTNKSRGGSRLRVINKDMLRHVVEHPAREYRWSVRELAAVAGCSPATLGHLLTGERDRVTPELAEQISRAVGVARPVLFLAPSSKESDNNPERDQA